MTSKPLSAVEGTPELEEHVKQIIAMSMAGINQPLWETRQKVEAYIVKHILVPVSAPVPSPTKPLGPEDNAFWEQVWVLQEQWEKVWQADRSLYESEFPKDMIDAATELFAHDLCDAWVWKDYVKAACVIMARHMLAGFSPLAAPVPEPEPNGKLDPTKCYCPECYQPLGSGLCTKVEPEARKDELSAKINALPDWARRYIHDIETRCDPAGDILTIANLRQNQEALLARIAELSVPPQPSPEAPANEDGAFEKWARTLTADRPYDLTRCDNPSCGPKFIHYKSDHTNSAWSAWEARARLVAPEKVGEERCDQSVMSQVGCRRCTKPAKHVGECEFAPEPMAEILARHAPAREGWIDVKERLPELGQWVWVVIDGVVQRMAAKLEEMSCMGEPSVLAWTWVEEESDSAPFSVVTDWQPLPEPPARHAVSREPEKENS